MPPKPIQIVYRVVCKAVISKAEVIHRHSRAMVARFSVYGGCSKVSISKV
jgi:hypothetical protein